ncbi:endothelin-converting enzyme homolog [Glandiceps talaboti]
MSFCSPNRVDKMEVNQNHRDKHCGYDSVEMNGIEKERLQPEIVTPTKRRGRRARLTRSPLIFALLLVLCISCITLAIAYASSLYQIDNDAKPKMCLTTDCLRTASFFLENMNTSVNPCEDFFHFSCGGWISKNPIPADQSAWGMDHILWQTTLQVLKQIVEEDIQRDTKLSSERKLKHLYKSCMNKAQIEHAQGEPLKKVITRLQGWYGFGDWDETNWDMLDALILLHGEYWNDPFFEFGVAPDLKNSDKRIIVIDQAGLGAMMDKYYLLGNHSHRVFGVFKQAIGKVADLLGATPQRRDTFVDDVISFHTTLAEIFVPEEERINRADLYNKLSIRQLQQLSPAIDWQRFFGEIFPNITASTELNVLAPEYMANLSIILQTTPSRKINNYMIWHVMEKYLQYLSINFRNVLDTVHQELTGTSSTGESWRQCVIMADRDIGMALGALYVKRKFPVKSKAKVEDMILKLKDALRYRFNAVEWMDARTKEMARQKLDAIGDFIGYPDYILNDTLLDQKYEKLDIVEDDFFHNVVSQSRFIYENAKKMLNEPIVKHGWQMTPPEVNAYYTPTLNDIVFPAGLLQWPFFDQNFPKSVNFGGIGSVIGHELTHGFDEYGAHFDKDGDMANWWTVQSWSNFKQRSQCLQNLYSGYEINGLKIKGDNTLDENIADIGGLSQAYHAYMLAVQSEGEDLPLPGLNLTQTQTFFLAYSQYWCTSRRPEAISAIIEHDNHSPEMYRIIGPMSQLKQFADAYKCPVGTRMNPRERCDGIWW